jgi:hypothetical protein
VGLAHDYSKYVYGGDFGRLCNIRLYDDAARIVTGKGTKQAPSASLVVLVLALYHTKEVIAMAVDVFVSPITDENMPKCVKYALEHLDKGEEIIEFERYSVGTPDGECCTDTWSLTTLQGECVNFQSWIINYGDEENYIYSQSWKNVADLSRLLSKIIAKNEEVA